MDWQAIAQERQQHLASTIAAVEPNVPDIPKDLPVNVTQIPLTTLPPDVLAITGKPVEVLLQELAHGTTTSLAVTQAFLQRAGLASKLVNCITELLPERALARAKWLDQYLAEHGKTVGPLHGLPISVKEHHAMKGLDLNAGFVAWVGRVAPDDSLLLKLLWAAGAVFYARTTQPQTLMHLETSSNIHGVTVNPYNTALTAGGSSGGEGALLGLRGSVLGVGSDIGGSIRSPAANNGVFGLRPTTYRLPLAGMAATMHGAEHIVPVVGPLSTSLAGLAIFMHAVLAQRPWLHEPSLIPLPWRHPSPTAQGNTFLRRAPDTGRRTLRIGLLTDDGVVRPHPPIQRGLRHLTSLLQSHPAIELVDFPPHRHAEAWEILSALYFADGGAEERAALAASAEPWRPLSEFILTDNPNCRAWSVPEVWAWTVRREAYRAAYAALESRRGHGAGTGTGGR